MSATGEEDPMDLGDDLFGDEDEGQEEVVEKARELDDEELDSGDDEGREDRQGTIEDATKDTEMQDVELRAAHTVLSRHNIPKPSNGELNSLKVPNFLSIAPKPYDPTTYRIPTADHHSATKSENFSACDTAVTTIRYRKNPATGKLESNTLLYRWSDGSVTMQVGDQHYEIDSKQLSQPKSTKYKPEFDSNTYLASAHVEAETSVLQIVGHMSNQLTVRPNKDLEDDALERLQNSMAAATRGRNSGDSKRNMVETTQDPELQKKQAELAEKERLKLQRRRETAAAKATQQPSRGLRTGASGLSIGDLEGRAATKKATKNKARRNRYDDSDDDRPRGRGNQDEYDREDDFLASSDEEEEVEAEDEDEDEEMIDHDTDKEEPKSKRGKKARDEDSDLDADGEVDPDAAGTTAAEVTVLRGKRRNIIEDDDDE